MIYPRCLEKNNTVVFATLAAIFGLMLAAFPSYAADNIWDGPQAVRELPMKMDRSRIFLNAETGRGFASLKNQSATPFYVSVFLRDTDDQGEALGKTRHFFATPASAMMRPKDTQIFHVVKRSTQKTAEDRETLLILEIKLIPSAEQKDASINEMMTLYLKVFSRPSELDRDGAILESTRQMKVSRSRKDGITGLLFTNSSPYWLTIPVIDGERTDSGDRLRSAMLSPFGTYFFPQKESKNTVVVQTIDENGFYTDPVTLAVE